MTYREMMQQALEALDSDNPDIQLRAAIALRAALDRERNKTWTPEHWTEYERGIVAAEREKVSQFMKDRGYVTGQCDSIEALLKQLGWQIDQHLKNASEKPKPTRVFSLQVGDTFVLRRTKQHYELLGLKWISGMGTQYLCRNLATGETVRLHHSMAIDKLK